MFSNVGTGWEIGKATRNLVFKDKRLIVFPFLATVAVIAEMIAIFLPSTAFLMTYSNPFYYFILVLLLFYFVVTFTSTYITIAMFISFRAFSNGQKIGFIDTFKRVKPYIKLIVEWSLFYSIVIVGIRLLESRFKGIASLIFGAIVSFTIALATLFVAPVILDKKLGPIKALKESSAFILKNFGKTFGGIAYTELYGFGIILIGVVIAIIGLVSIYLNLIIAIAIILAGIGIAVIGGMIMAMLSNILRLIIYDFLTYGTLPNGFTSDMLRDVVKQKNKTML